MPEIRLQPRFFDLRGKLRFPGLAAPLLDGGALGCLNLQNALLIENQFTVNPVQSIVGNPFFLHNGGGPQF